MWVCDSLPKDEYPDLRIGICIGGLPMREQARDMERSST